MKTLSMKDFWETRNTNLNQPFYVDIIEEDKWQHLCLVSNYVPDLVISIYNITSDNKIRVPNAVSGQVRNVIDLEFETNVVCDASLIECFRRYNKVKETRYYLEVVEKGLVSVVWLDANGRKITKPIYDIEEHCTVGNVDPEIMRYFEFYRENENTFRISLADQTHLLSQIIMHQNGLMVW